MGSVDAKRKIVLSRNQYSAYSAVLIFVVLAVIVWATSAVGNVSLEFFDFKFTVALTYYILFWCVPLTIIFASVGKDVLLWKHGVVITE